MRVIRFLVRFVQSLLTFLGNHYPAVAALVALAVASWLWIDVTQDTGVTINVLYGWRQAAIVGCAGLAFGGLAAECVALAGRSVPGETPVGSAIIAAIFAMPLYAACILLSLS